MRVLEEILSQPGAQAPVAQTSNFTLTVEDSGPVLHSWITDCHGFWHNAALVVASLLFVLYLGYQARQSFPKLSHGRSYIMIAYYACLWLVSLLNLAWCLFQVRLLSTFMPNLGFLSSKIGSFLGELWFIDYCFRIIMVSILVFGLNSNLVVCTIMVWLDLRLLLFSFLE